MTEEEETEMSASETFRFQASVYNGRPNGIQGSFGSKDGPFATKADAEAFVAQLPKSVKARATTLSGLRGSGLSTYVVGYVTFGARTAADGVNGGRNETGIKRYRSLRKALDKLGVPVEFEMPYSNSLTEAEFEATIAETS